MSRLYGRLILGLVFGVAVLVGFALYADLQSLAMNLGGFTWWYLFPVLGLTVLSYGLRFLKWHYFLGRAQIQVPAKLSVLVFLSGFSMAITPGKLGELIKSWLLKSSLQIPVARTAPVVVAERLTDLVALVLLCLMGAFTYVDDPRLALLLLLSSLAVLALTAVLAHPRPYGWLVAIVRLLPRCDRPANWLAEVGASLHCLLRPGPLVATSLFSALAWLGECIGFWLVINGLPGAEASLSLAVFIFSATTVAGALSFLPGGLGVTEGGMILLLIRWAEGLSRSGAVAATVLIRLCTLWTGVAIGFVALAYFKARIGFRLGAGQREGAEDQQ